MSGPETIYLQDAGDYSAAAELEVTWCVDPQDPNDTKYIRADLHAAAIARAERAEAALALAKEALQRAASYFSGCSYDRPFAAWNNVRAAIAKIAEMKGGAE